MTEFPRPALIATPAWLADQLGRPELRVIDVRWRPDGTAPSLHAAGHVPGAFHLDWQASVVEPDPEGDLLRLASPERIAEAMAAAGVAEGTSVVLYDDTLGYHAARVWWSLRAYGFETARVLEGGFPAWVDGSFPVASGPVAVSRGEFRPRLQADLHVTTSDVRGLLGSHDVLLVDARGPAEYHGFEGNVRRLGHIPGAVNLPVAAMHEPGSQRLRDIAELRALVLRANITRGRRLICYDQSGIAAAKLAWVLCLLGHEQVAVYDGGWGEWGARMDLPVNQ